MPSPAPPGRAPRCTAPTDTREPVGGPSAVARDRLAFDPPAGHLFVSGDRRGDRLEPPHWDEGGPAVRAERLEEGTCQFPPAGRPAAGVEVRATDLALIPGGVGPRPARRRRRHRRPPVP